MAEKVLISNIERVKKKFGNLHNESEQIVNGARKKLQAQIDGHLSLTIRNAAINQNIITTDERAQIINFVAKYQQLPEITAIDLIESDGSIDVENLDFARHVINEFRPIVWNRRDSIHYKRLFEYCSSKLTLKDPKTGTTLTVIRDHKEDITGLYLRYLENHRDAIEYILNKLDLDYIYNGVLQHSDKRFSKRHAKDYYSGELNYILVKHAYLLGPVKQLLNPFFICAALLCPDLQLGSL